MKVVFFPPKNSLCKNEGCNFFQYTGVSELTFCSPSLFWSKNEGCNFLQYTGVSVREVKVDLDTVFGVRMKDVIFFNTQGCLLGRRMQYQRRQWDSQCYNGRDYQRPTLSSTCLCSDEDYEW